MRERDKGRGFILFTATWVMVTLGIFVIAIFMLLEIAAENMRVKRGIKTTIGLAENFAALSKTCFELSEASFITDKTLLNISDSVPQVESIEDESTKLNINNMGYALPYVLNLISPDSEDTIKEIVQMLGESQKHEQGITRKGIVYYFKPDILVDWQTENNDPANGDYESRHYAPKIKVPERDTWIDLEQTDEIFIILRKYQESLEGLKLSEYFTCFETAGFNVNTVKAKSKESKILQGIMDWQREATLMLPKWQEYYEKFSYVRRGSQSRKKFDDPFLYEDINLLDSEHPSNNFFLGPRFKNSIFYEADEVIKLRDKEIFTTKDIIQNLLVFPLRNQILFNSGHLGGSWGDIWGVLRKFSLYEGYDIQTQKSYVGPPCFDFFLTGPGSYVVDSSYYTITCSSKQGSKEIRLKATIELVTNKIPRILFCEQK